MIKGARRFSTGVPAYDIRSIGSATGGSGTARNGSATGSAFFSAATGSSAGSPSCFARLPAKVSRILPPTSAIMPRPNWAGLPVMVSSVTTDPVVAPSFSDKVHA